MTFIDACHEVDTIGAERYRMTAHAKPRAYQRNGIWRPMTDQLGASGDPSLTIGCDEYMDFRIRDRLSGNAPVYHIGKGNEQIRLTPLDTNNVMGVVSGNTITFPEAWNNADLKLIVGGHIIRKEIVLRTGHPAAFEFRVDDHSGSGALIMLDPFLEKSGENNVPLQWITRTQGGKTIYRVELPAGNWTGWVLDPQYVSQPDATAGIDAFIEQESPTTNTGTNNTLNVGETNLAVFTDRSLIKFDISSIPSNYVSATATLSLYIALDRSGNARTFRLYRLKRNWVESQVTWVRYSTGNNWQTAGAFGALDCEQTDVSSLDFTSTEVVDSAKNFIISNSSVNEYINGTTANYGWLIKADTELDDRYNFHSSDATTSTLRPKLVIDYMLPTSGGYISAPISPVIRGVFK